MSLRIAPELRDRVMTAAQASGRSLTQEIELRLDKSFDREDLLPSVLDLAYGRKAASILLAVIHQTIREGRKGAAISGGSIEAVNNWPDDPFAYQQAMRGSKAMFDGFRPAADGARMKKSHVGNPTDPDWLKQVDDGVAITCEAIRNPDWGKQFPDDQRNQELEDLARQIRERAGPELLARITLNREEKDQPK